jgi:CRP-like cAMP-binding protein
MLQSKPTALTGIWLSPQPVDASIQPLLLQMLARHQPDASLRQAILEEFTRRAKLKDVALSYLGLYEADSDRQGEAVLYLAAPLQEETPWHQALLLQQSPCPIGFVINTWDYGRIAVVHEIFQQLTAAQKEVIRQYAALAVRGKHHGQILAALRRRETTADHLTQLLQEARRRMQSLDRSVLFSHDGEVRVQVGSLSQTTKNLLREGLHGEYLFILPRQLFEGRTNYADIEFIVYLNFFIRRGVRTRLAGRNTQKQALQRLLSLTIFGLFDPQLPTLPSFADLQQTYGVADQATYAFLHLCYEQYGIRGKTERILGIDDYVDFVLLQENNHPTLIPIYPANAGPQAPRLGTIRILPADHGAFDVRITQPKGLSTAKRLTVTPPVRIVNTIPDSLRRPIQFATDRPRFGVMPLGTSHGFDPAGDLTSFIIWVNGQGLLVDPSPESLGYLEHIGVAPADLLYVFLTHIHADHDGGLIEKLLSGSRTTIIASDIVFRLFVEKAQLVTGHDFQREGLVEHIAANPGQLIEMEIAGEQVALETRWNLHPIPTNGFKLTIGEKCFGYSGDTQYDPDLIRQLHVEHKLQTQQAHDLLYFFWTPEGVPTVDLLYHEAGIPPIHTDRRQLERLPEAVKTCVALVHIADRDVPPDAIPGKPPLFVTHTFLPPTPQSHRNLLLHTLVLVSYLYDAPLELLHTLAERASIKVFEPEEIVIRQGPVSRSEVLTFFVVADGKVAVKDGRRLIAQLTKGDSFGEWGISHQRGFRAADVVAVQPTQLLEFDETTYRQMVEKYPVIQQRIGRIRALLPRLQLAQMRARQQNPQHPEGSGRIIAEMNASQLSAFAVFCEVKKFNQGTTVVTDGEVADGFYILLSGHLVVVKEGIIGELSEGDVFGEVGLIEGGRRTATVNVMSADAEVLFMSQQNFQTLLQTVPAFSFGIRDLIARRHEMEHRETASRK